MERQTSDLLAFRYAAYCCTPSNSAINTHSQYMLCFQGASAGSIDLSQVHSVRSVIGGEPAIGQYFSVRARTVSSLPRFIQVKNGFSGSRPASIFAASFTYESASPNRLSK